VVHLWGQPLDPEAWAGAVVTATGGDGADVPMFTFAVDAKKGVVTEAGRRARRLLLRRQRRAR
jgi:hypothetical protein